MTTISQYPHSPGFKDCETSKAAAAAISRSVQNIRDNVRDAFLFFGPMTADEAAARIGLSILTVRPRVSELVKMGILHDTGERRRNLSGHSAKVFSL